MLTLLAWKELFGDPVGSRGSISWKEGEVGLTRAALKGRTHHQLTMPHLKANKVGQFLIVVQSHPGSGIGVRTFFLPLCASKRCAWLTSLPGAWSFAVLGL